MKNIFFLVLFFYFNTAIANLCSKIETYGLPKEIQKNIIASISTEHKHVRNEKDLYLAIKKAIQPYGFMSPKITLKQNASYCKIRVSLGKPTKISVIKNNDIFPKNIPYLKENSIFTSKKYNNALLWLYKYFKDKGYRDVDLSKSSIVINPNNREAQITLDVHLGKKYIFGPILLNNSFICKKLISRFISFKPGEPYSLSKLQLIQDNLRKSGYFSNVEVNALDEIGNKIPIEIKTTMQDTIQMLLGIGYDSVNAIKTIFNSKVILNKYGHVINSIASISKNLSYAQIQYLIPGSKPQEDKYLIQTSYTIDNSNDKKDKSANLSISYNKKNDFADISFGINAINNRQINSSSHIVTNILYPYFHIEKKSSTVFRGFPIKQQWSSSTLIAHKGLLSSINIFQVRTEYRNKIDLSQKVRLLLSGQLGVNATNDPIRQPLPTLLTLGGNNGLRGYSYNSIINRTENLQILRALSIELQRKISNNVYGSSFIDMGQISKSIRKPFLRGIGIGAVYSTTVGDISFSVAKPLDTPPDGSKKKIRFSVSYSM